MNANDPPNFASDELPWMPVSPGFCLKLLHGETEEDTRALLLRLEPGTTVGLHRHHGEVHAFHLTGHRQLIETREIIGPGQYLYEPAGNMDSWKAVGYEPLLVFVTVRGSIEELDVHGAVSGTTTTRTIADDFRRYRIEHEGHRNESG